MRTLEELRRELSDVRAEIAGKEFKSEGIHLGWVDGLLYAMEADEKDLRERYWEARDNVNQERSDDLDHESGFRDAMEFALRDKINPAPQWVREANYEV